LESNTFSQPFVLKKQDQDMKQKFTQLFFPTCQTSIFLILKSQGLDYEELSPQTIVRVKLRGREIGRKAILQSLWL